MSELTQKLDELRKESIKQEETEMLKMYNVDNEIGLGILKEYYDDITNCIVNNSDKDNKWCKLVEKQSSGIVTWPHRIQILPFVLGE